jgi:hypothetical protein
MSAARAVTCKPQALRRLCVNRGCDARLLNGGAVTLVATVPASVDVALRFAYVRGDERPRQDLPTLETAAGRLA